ncbi:hypothetical protein M758_6G068300 [Ceratodon purpureus]|nr:hypothetical protein M758_6G068300 [Ceratodon purpureus]
MAAGGRWPLILAMLVVVGVVGGNWGESTAAPVMSVDMGAEWVKVAVVNLKPGQPPISIVPNEMSKRKSPALVAFSRGDRLVSEEASGILARYPERVFASLRDMVGKPFGAVKELLKSQHLPYDVVEDASGRARIRVGEDSGSVLYSVEELLAMLLNYARDLAESHTKESIKDTVITVPPFFGQAERKGLLDAAEIAGLNVLTLVNEPAGASLQYGIDKDFSVEDRQVVFYDMGASNTYAALVHFTAYTTKSPGGGKNITAQQFHVKGVSWDSTLGGQTMETRLVDHFAAEFKQKSGIDVLKHPKGMAKLKKQVKRTKEILSANSEASITVESLADDHDFRSHITRKKFEELCKDLWGRSLIPLKQVLADNGLSLQQLHSVELLGGATRVPKLKEVLTGYVGQQALARHLDSDEAVVLGSSLRAANLSDGIKLNRKLGMVDGASYGIDIKLDGATLEAKDQGLLVPLHKNIPSKMGRTLKNQLKDFKVTLSYDKSGKLPPSISSPLIAAYQVKGVDEAVEKYKNHNQSAPMKTVLHFLLDRSGVVNLDRAEQVIEVSEWIDVVEPLANLTSILANLTANGTVGDLNGADFNLTKLLIDEGNLANGTAAGANNETAPQAPKQKLRKRILRVPLKITEVTEGSAKSLSRKELSEAIQRLEKLNAADAKKRATEAAKNNLESYIYSAKDQLETLIDSDKESSQADRDSFMEKLAEAEDWLYMDGENADASEFQNRLEALKSTWKSLFTRPEPAKEEESPGKDEAQPDLAANLEEVLKTAEQATRPDADISSPSHDEL